VKKVMVIPHHTGNAFRPGVFPGPQMRYGDLPDEIQPVVEIYSKHGASEYLHNPRPCIGQIEGGFARDYLERGHRFGFIAGSDTHQGNPGSSMKQPGPFRTLQYRNGLAAVWARELTREALWEAFFARRVYATTYPRVTIRFQIGDVFMGSAGKAPYPRNIDAEIASPLPINRVELIKNGSMAEAIPLNGEHHVRSTELFADARRTARQEDYYYLRVVFAGGEIAWSSPVWLRE